MSEATPTATDPSGIPELQTEPELKGIRGWLLLPPLHLLINMGMFVWLTVSHWAAFAATTVPVAGVWAAFGLYVLNAVVALYALVCLARLFEKKSYVPKMMIAFYLLIITKAVLDLVALLLYPELSPGQDALFQDSKGVAQALVAGVIWISYFRMSVRVKNTFVN